MMAFLTSLLAQWGPELAAGLAGLVVLIGTYFKGHSAGKNKERQKQLQATVKAHEKRNEIDDKVDADSIDDVRSRLRDDARS